MCTSPLLRLPLLVFSILIVLLSASLQSVAQSRPGGVNSLLWYDANQGVNVVAAGTDDNVMFWTESSGSTDQLLPSLPVDAAPGSYSLRQGTAGVRPNLVTDVFWGNKPVVRFDMATSDRLSMFNTNAAVPLVNNSSFGQKMFSVVFSLKTLPASGTRMVILNQGNTNIGLCMFVANTPTSTPAAVNKLVCGVYDNTTALGTGRFVTSVNPLVAGQKYIATVIFDNPGGIFLYINGVSEGTNATNGNLTAHNNTGFTLGTVNGNGIRWFPSGTGNTNATGGSNPFNGDIAEFVYANVASRSVRAAWENYFAERWGVTLTGAADYYSPTTAGYTTNLVGIGKTDLGTILETDFGSNGLYLRNKTTLVDNGDYVMAANNNATGLTTVGTNGHQLNRQWVCYSTNTGASEGLVTLMFDPVEEGSGSAPQIYNVHDYYLLVNGAQTMLNQAYIDGGRICFDLSVSVIHDKVVTLGTLFAVAYTRYQPGGVKADPRLWYDATPLNYSTRLGAARVKQIVDQTPNQYDARTLSASAANGYDYTATPDYTEDLFGLGINGFQFKSTTAGTAGYDAMRVLTGTGAAPVNLNSGTFDNKMLVAYFKPTSATTFTGPQIVYEQGTSADGFNIYLHETGGTRTLRTGVWRRDGSDYNIYHSTPLAASNNTNYLVSWSYSRLITGTANSFVNGTSIGNTAIPTTGSPALPFQIRSIAGDNVGIGGVNTGTRNHADAVGGSPTHTGERYQGNLWELVHFNDSRQSLRKLVENYIAAKYNHSIASPLFNLATAQTKGAVNQLIGIGSHIGVLGDSVNKTDFSSGGLYISNAASSGFLKDNGDYLLAAHNGAWGTSAYNGSNGQLLSRVWYVDSTDVPTVGTGGNVVLSFAIDQEGSDRTTYLAPQYFIRDSTNHAEIGLGTASIVAVSATDRRIVFTVNATQIADRFITLGIKDRTLPVECNCTHTTLAVGSDDDSDALIDTADPDCMNRWRCNGEFIFSEFQAGGDANQITSIRRIEPGTTVSFTGLATSSRLRKIDASGFQRRDSMVYGFINEGTDVNRLMRVQSNGTMIDLGVPITVTTTFPAGASAFVAGDGYMSGSILGYAFANNAANSIDSKKYVGLLRFDGVTKPTVINYSVLAFTDGTIGTPNFSDMAFDPTLAQASNNQAYAYDINQKVLIRVNVTNGNCAKVTGALVQSYDDVESMFFTEFGELYGYATQVLVRQLVHINKTSGVFTPVGTGLDIDQVDGCSCGSGISIRVTPVAADNSTAITSVNAGGTTVRYRVDIQNNTGATINNLTFAESFSDGRQFTAFTAISPTQTTAVINGGAAGVLTFAPSSSISISGLRASFSFVPTISSFILTVSIPASLDGKVVKTQPLMGNIGVQFGTSKVSDYLVTNAVLRDSTPLTILAPLPVEWAAFEAMPMGNAVRLNWATYSEVNNIAFYVERSFNGEDWAQIAELPGAVNSQETQAYTAWDNSPNVGVNYYRIRQMDIYGSVTLSDVRTVSFTEANGLALQTYPNPATPDEVLNIVFVAPEAIGTYELTITDLSGRVIFATTKAATPGANVMEIPLNAMAKGLYLVTVASELHTASQKLVVH